LYVVDQTKQRVQKQFGDKAALYAISKVHVDRPSLARLVEVVAPQREWLVLDVATGAGHTAHALAPHVRRVVATDLTLPMLPQARQLAEEKELSNVVTAAADAEGLPFAGASFDLVTCRIAPHHFPHVERFLAEAARVLRPAGRLALVDNFVPGSPRRGKKARLQRAAGRYINAFDRLRDPSHVRCLSVQEWREALYATGFTIEHEETTRKAIDFHDWVERMKVPPESF
jgi:ubiquinone/menaquinone biosynthesis C-methylase UbiE